MLETEGKAGGEGKAEKAVKFPESQFSPQYIEGNRIYPMNLTELVGSSHKPGIETVL